MDPRLVQIGIDVSTIDQAIEKALEQIRKVYRQEVQYEDVLARIQERQKLGGTTFESGIAIPHARIPSFNDFLIAAVVPKTPIAPPDGSAVQTPTKIVYLILISNTASTLYLNTLAKLVESSKDQAIMDALLKAENPSTFVGVFEKAGYIIKKNLTVADIMTRDVVSVPPTASVKELTDAMYSRHLRYIPIVDDKGKFVGEIGIIDLIKAGIPDYAFRIGSLKFLSELEPMTELLSKEDLIKVEAIMKKNPACLDPSISVIEAAFEMTKNVKRHYAVVDQGKIVGVVSAMDILNKVIRA